VTTNQRLLAENDRLRALLRAANERAEHAEAQLPLPTELVLLKPAAFATGVNYETARGWNLHHRVGGRRLEAVSKLIVRRVVHQAELWLPSDRRVDAFGEPAIDWSEKIAGLIPLALIAVEPRHADRRAQLPGLRPLLALHFC
jgi:hypothetical protein